MVIFCIRDVRIRLPLGLLRGEQVAKQLKQTLLLALQYSVYENLTPRGRLILQHGEV